MKLQIQGIDIEYKIAGDGEVFVFLPGTLGDHHILDSIVNDIPKKVITINHPDAPFEKLVSLYHELLTSLEVNQFHLAGTSVGGWIAIHYAKTYPDQVLSLTMSSSFSDNKLLRQQSLRLFKLLRFIPWFIIKVIFKKNVLNSVERFENGEFVAKYLVGCLEKMGKQALVTRLSWSLESTDPVYFNGKMKIIYAQDDRVVSVDNTDLLIQAHPQATTIKLETGDHYPYLLYPNYVDHLLSEMN